MEITKIATFHSPFSTKFGIPKQSGLVEELESTITFEPGYRQQDYVRGIEGFDYLWLIWGFSANRHKANSPVVRPPVLGGNDKVGVFATRSPFRPNPIGLSSVRLLSVEHDTAEGTVLHVGGADIMDGTPIYDIKPYLPYSDAHQEARSGFSSPDDIDRLSVVIPDEVASVFGTQQLETLRKILELDPRPSYHSDPEKVYGVCFMDQDIHFKVANGVCTVIDSQPQKNTVTDKQDIKR